MTSLQPFTAPQAIGLLAVQGTAVAVWYGQNRSTTVRGGRIAFSKAVWLVYAVTLWFLAPLCLATNAATSGHTAALAAWSILAASMWTRGLCELWMLKQETWRVRHGLLHDRVHIGLSIAMVPLLMIGHIGLLPLLILLLSLLSLVSEILFVHWFSAATAGPQGGIYFVPGDADQHGLLRRSSRIFVPQFSVFIGALTWCIFAA